MFATRASARWFAEPPYGFDTPPHDGSTKEGRIYSRPLGRHPQSGFSPADMEKPSVECGSPNEGGHTRSSPPRGSPTPLHPNRTNPRGCPLPWLSIARTGAGAGQVATCPYNQIRTPVSSFRRNQSAGVTHLPAFAATPPSRGCARLSYGQARWRIHIPRSPFIRAHKVDNSHSSEPFHRGAPGEESNFG